VTELHPKLDSLTTDDFAIRLGLISNPRAIHRRLQVSDEVHSIRRALANGEITEESLRRFTAELLCEYAPDQLFGHEMALAAIAVVLETRATAFASEFIGDLARLELSELPIAIRVARESARIQLSVTGSKSRLVRMRLEQQPCEWQLKLESHPVEVGQSNKEFQFEVS